MEEETKEGMWKARKEGKKEGRRRDEKEGEQGRKGGREEATTIREVKFLLVRSSNVRIS